MSAQSARFVPVAIFPRLLFSEPFNAPGEEYQVVLASLSTPPEATLFFHSDSVIFPFCCGRRVSPAPWKIPAPVMAIFSRPSAVMGDWHLAAFTPSKEDSTSGYC